ncbi:exosortase N [Saccharicrinis sp. GN24d3]|uniref:exosortase N n=1 Tax=Saccharicrinis sp. GN24d3 TaxID=3458416 RepID=UPI004036F309
MKFLKILAFTFSFHMIGKLNRYTKLVWSIEELVASKSKLLKEMNLGYVAVVIVTLVAIPKFNEFGGLRFEQLLFFMALPFTLTKTGGISKFTPLFLLSTVLLVVFYMTHVYSILFFGVCCALLSSLVVTNYRPTLLSLLLSIICTPAVKYFLSIYSFPLRLKVSQLAGNMLMPITNNLTVQGNCIFLNDIEFTVAPECLGLNMIASALVFAIFTLSFFAGKYNKRPRMSLVIGALLLALTLVLIANLTRIILTVLLQAMPETLIHETIGLLIFVVNCCIPLLFIGIYGKVFYKRQKIVRVKFGQQHYLSLAIAPLLIIGSYDIHENSFKTAFDSSSVFISGFERSESTDGVIKLENDSALVYIKPPAFMLGSDHNPFICWRASGFNIKKEAELQIGVHYVYSFELHKPNEQPLYSCWWYSNGGSHTISQWQWRLANIKGEDAYSVINVTSADKSKSLEWTEKMLSQNLFNPKYQSQYGH